MPAFIKPKLILVAHTDDLGLNKTSHQQQQMLIQNLKIIVSRPNVTPGQIMHCTTNCIPINLMFMETFLLTHRFGTACAYMSHRNDCRQRGVTKNISHQEVKCSATSMGRADNQLIATICGCSAQPFLMMAIQIIHKQERGTHSSACTAAIDVSKHSNIRSSR